ncbi:MAG: NAD(P)H-dependent oxidoreductase [Patescibacteria group bacterium]|jgi:NAD(P)H dehydrogenase (quinone)|nr:NAD(P)H-dependent oxidoreductase [Patescibacteria group bacterium]
MKSLIIKAHPASYGFTHKIAFEYKKGALESGKEVEIIDLYSEEYKQEYFSFEDLKNISRDPKRDLIQEKIKESDELVFVFPMWWWGAPAIMKNFIDTNFLAGFAYRFQKSGIPLRLLKGKTARIFVTSDGPWIFYFFFGMPVKKVWKYGTFMTCGIKLKSFKLFSSMRKANDKEKKKYLEKVYQISKK